MITVEATGYDLRMDWVDFGLKLGTLITASGLVSAAVATLVFRVRVDHSDQWWKQVNVAIEHGLSEDDDASDIAMAILLSLQDEEPPTRPSKFHRFSPNQNYRQEKELYRADKKLFKKKRRQRWRIGEREKSVLAAVSNKVARKSMEKTGERATGGAGT